MFQHVQHQNPVVMMGGDIQDNPENKPKLLNKFQDGYNVVYAAIAIIFESHTGNQDVQTVRPNCRDCDLP